MLIFWSTAYKSWFVLNNILIWDNSNPGMCVPEWNVVSRTVGSMASVTLLTKIKSNKSAPFNLFWIFELDDLQSGKRQVVHSIKKPLNTDQLFQDDDEVPSRGVVTAVVVAAAVAVADV